MRLWIAGVALVLLSACGQPQSGSTTASTSAVSSVWSNAMAPSAQSLHTYPGSEIVAVAAGTVRAGEQGVQITTDPHYAQLSVRLPLGELPAGDQAIALKVTTQVERGSFVMFVLSEPIDGNAQQDMVVNVDAGPGGIVYIPLPHRHGPQALFISNGNQHGVSSGQVTSVELIGDAG